MPPQVLLKLWERLQWHTRSELHGISSRERRRVRAIDAHGSAVVCEIVNCMVEQNVRPRPCRLRVAKKKDQNRSRRLTDSIPALCYLHTIGRKSLVPSQRMTSQFCAGVQTLLREHSRSKALARKTQNLGTRHTQVISVSISGSIPAF